MTVSRRILWQVAVGVIFVVTVATTVSFWLVYDALKRRDLRQLETYVTERAEREEARFQIVETNMKLVRGQFLKRLAVPMTAEQVEARFNYWNRRYPDGAWRTREEFGDARRNSSFWADREWPATLEALRALDAEAIVPGRGEAMKGRDNVNRALDYTKRWVETLYQAGKEAVAQKMDLKAAMAHTRKSMDPIFGHVFIYEHCLPFDVSRAYDEASGIKNPRIWTAERDMEMWKSLQG